ncbi:MAG: hybrid sensor histidine kinase/response regulator [Candidatus Marinimicrobia bacterium]|nr:hybrid sensor histidine kinase/response regulator [Candidatus Neomarinimicrobiota bacterium]
MAQVLIVDDNISVVGIMEDLLKIQGHVTHTAYDGTTAIERAKKLIPDLILLDVEMPGMDGISVCRELREHKATQLIPIVIVTGKTDSKTLMGAIKAGADDFLTKPADLPILKARVDSLLRMSHLRNQLAEKEKFETTINQIQNGIIITDSEGMIQNFNSTARQMFSFEDDSVANQPFLYIINQSFKSKINDWNMLTRQKYGDFIIYRMENDFKLRFALELKYNVILNPLGEIDEVVFVANEETSRINDDRRKDLFLTMLKHKFATVETITQLSLESLDILVESKDPALEKSALDGLQRASNTLNGIMRKLIKYVRMPDELNMLETETISEKLLVATVKSIIDALQIDSDSIEIIWNDVPDFEMIVEGLHSILYELIENAVKFSDMEKPRINLTVNSRADNVAIEILNIGPKIPQEELNRVWDRFYQVDRDITGQVKGIGLGMSIVKYIINLIGGNVEINSTNNGTTVTVHIPVK